MKSEKDYYLKLDIIRIISCLIVILYHLNIVAGGFLIVTPEINKRDDDLILMRLGLKNSK